MSEVAVMNVTQNSPSVFELSRLVLQVPDTKTLVITGAGVSAESGVPTFRGAGETWRDKHFTQLASPLAFELNPREIWDWYLYRRGIVAQAKPNAAHQALADWARRTGRVTLMTQNVDDLHEQAGSPDVIHFHGSIWHNRCTKCEAEREDRSLTYEGLPMSPCCGALERPAIVWFGESIPPTAIRSTLAAQQEASVVLVVGTSGMVSSASIFLMRAIAAGQMVIFVNLEEADVPTHLFLQGKAGEILPALLAP
jgi:NAD-dependent deacetylase